MNIANKIFNRVCYCYKLYKLKIPQNSIYKFVLNDKEYIICNINELEINDIKKLDKERTNYYEIIENRFLDDTYIGLCIFDILKNEIVSIQWIKKELINIHEIDKEIILKENQAYFIDDFTVPKHRGKGFHSKLMHYRLEYCKKQLIDEIFILIMCGNNNAIKTTSKLGFEKYMSYFKIRGLL